MILRILHLEGSTIRNVKGFGTKQKLFQIEIWKWGRNEKQQNGNYEELQAIIYHAKQQQSWFPKKINILLI